MSRATNGAMRRNPNSGGGYELSRRRGCGGWGRWIERGGLLAAGCAGAVASVSVTRPAGPACCPQPLAMRT